MISDVCGSKYSRIYSGKSGGAMWYMAPPLYIEEGSGGPTGYPVSLGIYYFLTVHSSRKGTVLTMERIFSSESSNWSV